MTGGTSDGGTQPPDLVAAPPDSKSLRLAPPYEGPPKGVEDLGVTCDAFTEDTLDCFSVVEGVLGRLIAASSCATPETGVSGRPPEGVAMSCGLFDIEGVLVRTLGSLAGLCGRTAPDVVNGLASRFAGLRGRATDGC